MERTETPAPLRLTKLVCTLGPAAAKRVDALVVAGMDVARLNLSHGTAAWHAATAQRVREAAQSADRPVALMVDLPGPKVRLGKLSQGTIRLDRGQPFVLVGPGTVGTDQVVSLSDPSVLAALDVGDRVLLADGAVELRVTRTGDAVEAEIVRGGVIRSNQGVNVPAERMSAPALTTRDRRHIPLLRRLGGAFVAQSFVRAAGDVLALRATLGPGGPRIVAKIETRAAVDDFDAILDVADAVMIARGDLGVELPFEEVPIIQKQLIARALEHGVPSIVATQMLESMTSSPRPTRAEASDVANAVFDGTDAILLSAETAIGEHPVLAAEAAVRVIRTCETTGVRYLPSVEGGRDMGDRALAYAAVALATRDVGTTAIVCLTRSGRTARLLASLRPPVPIVAVSGDPAVLDALALVRGVVPRPRPGSGASGAAGSIRSLRERGDLRPGGTVVYLDSTGPLGSSPDRLEILAV